MKPDADVLRSCLRGPGEHADRLGGEVGVMEKVKCVFSEEKKMH